jgi:hypothetical protein
LEENRTQQKEQFLLCFQSLVHRWEDKLKIAQD